MGAAKGHDRNEPHLIRKSVTVDATKLETLRRALGLARDSDVLRMAFEHFYSQFDARDEEE
jgi:hypothetical protein